MTTRILAADIGATNSRFAHFEAGPDERLSCIQTQWLKTADAVSFAHLLALLRKSGFRLEPEQADIAVIAIAGPVERGLHSAPPFIPWEIDIANALHDFGLQRCFLINDFVAQAFACRSSLGARAEAILPGRIAPEAAAAVVGAGTALGKAALVPDGTGGFLALPSEGGHADFPFASAEEFEFRQFLVQEYGEERISAHAVVSGKGLSDIHRFLTGETLAPGEVVSTFSPGSETLAWASRFYARVCRNYALDIVARGGVYIVGGVAARAPALLTHRAFAAEFRSSRTMGHLLSQIPVFLISNEESGLWGAGFFGLQQVGRAGISNRR